MSLEIEAFDGKTSIVFISLENIWLDVVASAEF